MPPFTTVNGQTGYYINGQFVPATQQEYNAQFGQTNQMQNQFNPFLFPSINALIGRQDFVPKMDIQNTTTDGITNEQKISQAQGNDLNKLDNATVNQNPAVNQNPIVNQNPAVNPATNAAANPMINFGTSMASTLQGFLNPQNPYNQNNVVAQAPTGTTGATGGGFFSKIANQVGNNVNNVATAAAATGSSDGEIPTVTLTKKQLNNPDGENWLSKLFKKNPGETTTTTSPDGGGKGNLFKGTATTSAIGGGIGAASKLIGSLAPGNYDERVGMTDPNLMGTVLGDATFTQIGSSFGPVGMAIGGGVDLVKNIAKYAKQKDRYENKKLATDTMQSIDDARENMKPDYTGYARFGTQVNPYIKKFNSGGETPMYSWGTGYDNSPNISKIVSTVSSSNTQTNPSISQKTAIPLKNIPTTNINSKKKILPYIDEFTGLNNSKNDKSYYSFDENIYNDDVFKNVAIDNTYIGINPNMKKVSNFPYDDVSQEGKLNTTARDYLEEIYTSSGYKEKLKKELKKSGITDKSADDIINERLYRVQNAPMQALSKNDPSYEKVYGYMQPMNFGPFITSPSIRMRADRVKTEPYNYFSTAIEELEHASHVKQNKFYNMFNSESSQNITPEAKRIFDLHAPATSNQSTQFNNNRSLLKRLLTKPYLKQYTENMAKKRAAEVYLINEGLINPGENVNEDHYKFLLENYYFLPSNVKSAIDMTNENKDANQLLDGIDKEFLDESEQYYDNQMKMIKSKKNPTKDDFKYYYNHQKKKEELLKTKQKYKKSQENFLKVMNEVAMQSNNNPYVTTARFGTQVNKSNINKYKVGGNTDPEEPKKSYESAAPNSIVLDSGGVESNDPVKEKENAINTMQSIYNSKGYQDKLNRELSKSNKMSYRNRFVFSNPFSPVPFEDGFEVYEKNNDRKYENKSLLDRRKEGLNVDISYMDANDENINDAYGYYATDLWEPAKQERENEGLIQYISKDPYIKINPKGDHEYYTLIEELEHASHYPGKNTSYYSRSSYPSSTNITPYAQKILKKNIGVKYEDNEYLTELSEAMAKKRATEAYLIENGLLKPGEKVDKSHFEFLKDVEVLLPSNVKSMLEMTNSKIENYFLKDYRFTNSSKIMKKKNKDHYKRFENIMNKIAMQQNPYINEPIS